MQKKNILVSLVKLVACTALFIGTTALVQAQEKSVDGTWTWTQPGRNGGADRTNTLVLKIEGAKLKGDMFFLNRNGQTNKIAISEGTIKDGQIAFNVTNEFNGNKRVVKYSGKVEGDTIKGKAESERNGEPTSRDWKAKRK